MGDLVKITVGSEKGELKAKLESTSFLNFCYQETEYALGKELYELQKNVGELNSYVSFDTIQVFWLSLNDAQKPYSFGKSNYILPSSIFAINLEDLPKTCISQQKIIFGPPGTGKSFSVDAIAKDKLGIIEPVRRIQTVFHPEYTYGEFIAKLMPISINGTVEYRVVAGHFIKALAKALTDDTNVLLQIDEINRGNCAAIFGDIFQLLDRDSEGNSSYSIQLSELALRALAQELVEKNDDGSYDEEKLKNVISEHTKGVKIPKNLSIVATMNTSDESVYFMDSAFKRRWQFEYISANHDLEDTTGNLKDDQNLSPEVKNQRDAIVKDKITWDCLRRSINLFMIANAKTIRGIEDKQIGLWFVKASSGAISEDDIQYKLMHYLWDNVFARDKKPLRELLVKNETELATFGQFVKLKDEFVTKVLAKCPCEKPECNQTETAQ